MASKEYREPCMKKTMNWRIIGLFAFITFCWGLGWPASKIGLTYLSPLWYTSIRMLVGTFTMMLVVIGSGKFSLPRWNDCPLIITIGLLQISIYILLANIGLQYLPAGRSSLLGYTTPLFVMPIAIWIFKEESTPLKWIGFILGVSGLLLLLNPWEINWLDFNVMFGSLMLLLAAFCWGISMLCARYMEWRKSPLELVPWQLLIGTLPILLWALIKEPHPSIMWNTPLFLSIIYTGALVTGLSYWSGVVINKELPTIIASLGFLAVPVFSLIISAIFLHESINISTAIAMAMIFLGLICVCV